jgi:hypothetical protein
MYRPEEWKDAVDTQHQEEQIILLLACLSSQPPEPTGLRYIFEIKGDE